jgi:hypothetical protein
MSELSNVINVTAFQGVVDNLLKPVENPPNMRAQAGAGESETPRPKSYRILDLNKLSISIGR